MGKLVIDPGGLLHLYYTPTCPEYAHNGSNHSYTITASHIDRKGHYVYELTMYVPSSNDIVYELWRVDPSGSTLEIAWNRADYPDAIDSQAYEYYTFYRK